MSIYQGMRWFKCDLQVQTPEDAANWLDDDLCLGDPRRPKINGIPSEDAIQEKARTFLRRCHEIELDVIGVTDHNFSGRTELRDWFLTHLVEQNEPVAKECGRDPLFIFPGFEADIGYHVLCLFEPVKKAKHLERVSTVLTTLGLTPEARFLKGRPQPLRRANATISLKELLEVVQGDGNGIVIAAHADQKDGLLFDSRHIGDYGIEDLLAVELTKNPPPERYARILAGQDPQWIRQRSPAWIMSSDAKSLKTDADGLPRQNALGYRHTRIKMSNPSIEALRQAFLDPESRIQRCGDIPGDPDPNKLQKHPRIVSISISGARFLENQEIVFSPNMNCLIGGRGSGKSTVLEYLRIVMGKTVSDNLDEETSERVSRARETITPSTKLSVRWYDSSGEEDIITLQGGGEPIVEGRELIDRNTFFNLLPIRFFSQHELNRLTELRRVAGDSKQQGAHLLRLIDGFVGATLESLAKRELAAQRKLKSLFVKRREVEDVSKELVAARQEHQQLKRQWKVRGELQDDAHRHRALRAERLFIDGITAQAQSEAEQAVDLANLITNQPLDKPSADGWPHAEWARALRGEVEEARAIFAAELATAAENYSKRVEKLFATNQEWAIVEQELAEADSKFAAACEQKGVSPEDIDRLKDIDRRLAEKAGEVAKLEQRLSELDAEASALPTALAELYGLWREQFSCRRKAAQLANERATLKQYAGRFIDVIPTYCGDRQSFNEIWDGFGRPDGRTKLGRHWDEIGETIFSTFQELNTDYASPWHLLSVFLDDPTQCKNQSLAKWLDDLREWIRTKPEAWERAQLSRVRDAVDMVLFRADGSEAGRISDGTLSDGQRNTAALALLLAHGEGPLVIDQPEDELDSSFVFQELIPMLRSVKAGRQIIMATHNANLPVNGDAELVMALEARNGRGAQLACGGLDRKHVSDAVLDIMEGSELAFRRRYEKYHF